MRKIIIGLMVAVVALIAFYGLLISCGQQAAEVATTTSTSSACTTSTTISSSTISGTVMVPSSSLSSMGLKGLITALKVKIMGVETAEDGVSDTRIPDGAKVHLLDVVTQNVITAVATDTVSNGGYNLDLTSALANGTISSGDQVMVEAYYESGSKTLREQSIVSPGGDGDINAGTTLVAGKILNEIWSEAANLLEQATISDAEETEIKNIIKSLFPYLQTIVGTISSDNIPDLVSDRSDETENRKESIENAADSYRNEETSSTDSVTKSTANSLLTEVKTEVATATVRATYLAVVELKIDDDMTEIPGVDWPSRGVGSLTIKPDFNTNLSQMSTSQAEALFADVSFTGLATATVQDIPILPDTLAGSSRQATDMNYEGITNFSGSGWDSTDAFRDRTTFTDCTLAVMIPENASFEGTTTITNGAAFDPGVSITNDISQHFAPDFTFIADDLSQIATQGADAYVFTSADITRMPTDAAYSDNWVYDTSGSDAFQIPTGANLEPGFTITDATAALFGNTPPTWDADVRYNFNNFTPPSEWTENTDWNTTFQEGQQAYEEWQDQNPGGDPEQYYEQHPPQQPPQPPQPQ